MATLLLFGIMLFAFTLPGGITWQTIFIFAQGAWSVFWSYAPTPEPDSWYNAFFHLAQWIAFNPGRSSAVSKVHMAAAAAAGTNGGKP